MWEPQAESDKNAGLARKLVWESQAENEMSAGLAIHPVVSVIFWIVDLTEISEISNVINTHLARNKKTGRGMLS